MEDSERPKPRRRKPSEGDVADDRPAAATPRARRSAAAAAGDDADGVAPKRAPRTRKAPASGAPGDATTGGGAVPAGALPNAPPITHASPPAPAGITAMEAPDDAPAMVPSFARKTEPPRRAPAPARPADTSTRSARIIDWVLGYVPDAHRARVREYLVLMRLDRPVGALLLLWPTWWALWFAANDFPPPGVLVIFTLGVFVMRSAGCVINDYADHGWLDAHVERTRGRPMAAGRVTKKEALLLFGGLLAFAFVLVLFTNALTIKLAFVGAALAAVYPFTKRVTHLAQVVLGAAFGWSIPMAFAAVTNSLPQLCWLLFLANVLFSVVYDTEYAMVDRDEDIRVGAKSTAILFGDADRVIIGVLMATFLFAMLLAGTRVHLHWPYFLGLAGATGLFGWQQWLIRARARDACFAAFHNNNLVGLLIWLGLLFAMAIR
ncbi:4-hydroxybenzoate polyprenyltransferase [Dokdonella fugitiva]|uniref:4-hydroxybenzoate octaprenyltransferase n=1 Tax=Dokdonella fugitiva TaxID=328517 RepID=A0A839ESI7_9GAMM|nr:4-hydroxybenzoate octaprenyltransferase [Dokdonella fugitiva]MBA8887407.1 4-hydroxybenzoate polyprenyltransferase [Dokdonella fugitiva]